MGKMDIFEDLKSLFGCKYISDMTGRDNRAARKLVKVLNLKRYPLSQLRNLYQYLHDRKCEFADYSEAKQAFEVGYKR